MFNKFHLERKRMRLPQHDYKQAGYYFVTVCTQGMMNVFGEVVDREVRLNDAGRMVEQVWMELSLRFSNIKFDAFVVMPNHIHGIIEIMRVGDVPLCVGDGPWCVGAPLVGARVMRDAPNITRADTRPARTLGDMICVFKSVSTCEYIRNVKSNHWVSFDKRLWHRNYFDHVIRDAASHMRIRDYITTNPLQWSLDEVNNDGE